jgi:hypothetical protein
MGKECVDSKVAGDFAAGSSAHAITNDKSPGGRRGCACILVAATNLAAVGEHGVDEFVGSHGIEHENLVRRKQYTLRPRRPRVR